MKNEKKIQKLTLPMAREIQYSWAIAEIKKMMVLMVCLEKPFLAYL